MDEVKVDEAAHQKQNLNQLEHPKSPTLKKKLEPLQGTSEHLKKKGVNFLAPKVIPEGKAIGGSGDLGFPPIDKALQVNEIEEHRTRSKDSLGNANQMNTLAENANLTPPIPKSRRLSYEDFSTPRNPITRVSNESFTQQRSKLSQDLPHGGLSVVTKLTEELEQNEHPRTHSPMTPLEPKNSVKSINAAHRSISKSKNQKPASIGIDPNRRISIADNMEALRPYISKDPPVEEDKHSESGKGNSF
ncbi:hypothetical protein HDV01_006659 [Terramyces sp. JEL0728]|nr:hypothetical protein HDV01_006659 [Terramyces sp. JEL0728]